MENKSGSGSTSPFGNEKGATMKGSSDGAHDFTKDPASAAPKTGGRDFTDEHREQETMERAPTIDPASIPQGGLMPFSTGDKWAKAEDDTDGGAEPAKMPFKNLK